MGEDLNSCEGDGEYFFFFLFRAGGGYILSLVDLKALDFAETTLENMLRQVNEFNRRDEENIARLFMLSLRLESMGLSRTVPTHELAAKTANHW